MDHHIAEIDSLVAEIERLRDGPPFDYQEAYKLAEENRGKDPRIEMIFHTFCLFSSVEGPTALDFLKSRADIPFVAARVGYFLIHHGDVAQGLPLLQQAASTGHQFAQHALAVMAYNGDNMAKDVQGAVETMKALAAQEFLPAVYSLGVHYYKSPFEAKGDETGLNLIREAAKAGYKTAIEVLPDLERRAIMFGVAATSY